MQRTLLAALAALLVLAVSGSAVAADRSAARRHWRNDIREQALQAQPPGTAQPQGEDCLGDPSGDVVESENFEDVDAPQADILEFCVIYGADVTLSLELDEASDPSGWAPFTGALWTLDTDFDDELEYDVYILSDLSVDVDHAETGERACATNADLDGAVLSVTFDPSCLDDPRTIEADASFFFQRDPDSDVLFVDVTDYSPPVRSPNENADGALAIRLSGPSRIETAVEVSRFQFPDGASLVFLARADAFADALGAGALTGGPVLLVPTCGALPEAVRQEIERLEPEAVVAVGGPNAICPEMLAAASQAAG